MAPWGVLYRLLMSVVTCDRFLLFYTDLTLTVVTHQEWTPKAKRGFAIAPFVDRMIHLQWAFILRPRSAEWLEILYYKCVHAGVSTEGVVVLSKSMFSPGQRLEALDRASYGLGLELAHRPSTHISDAKANSRAMPGTDGVRGWKCRVVRQRHRKKNQK